jgi:polyhydroxyalkanoate synthesis repressor PhaR
MIAEASRSSAHGAPTSTVVLKKYGNRRLYDTNASRYVTLHEVEEMVQRGTDIQVVDAKSGEDLTKEILVQIILESLSRKGEGAREVLPVSFLKQVVQMSASPLKESFSRVLQNSLDGFVANQRALVDAQRSLLQQLPQALPQMSQLSQGMWNPFNAFAPPAPQHAQQYPVQLVQQPQAQQQVQQQQQSAEVEQLRAEMSETQALLRKLIDERGAPAPKKSSRKKR